MLAASGWDDLDAVRAPITLIHGERGFLTPADVEDYRTRLPEAATIALASGHNVQEEAPAELAAVVAEVVARHAGRSDAR